MSAAFDHFTRLDVIAKTGMAARGVVYLLFGLLMIQAGGHVIEGQVGAFAALSEVPAGQLILFVIAAGLLAYAIFRLCAALFDVEKNGTSLIGVIDRIGHFSVFVTYMVLAASAAEIAAGWRTVDASYGYGANRFLAQRLLEAPLGSFVVGLAGTGFLVAAGLNIKNALKGSHMRFTRKRSPRWIRIMGQLGMFSQAWIGGLIGWSILRAAWLDDGGQAKALGAALGALKPHGFTYNALAAGMLAFGAFSLLLAHYRCVPKLDLIDHAKARARLARMKLRKREPISA
jgi:hypothetical protein